MELTWASLAVIAAWAVWLAAVVDWWLTDPVDVRLLAKPAWVLTFLFFWVIGAVVWFVWGHPWHRSRDA